MKIEGELFGKRKGTSEKREGGQKRAMEGEYNLRTLYTCMKMS
jgi:hypothetical protein